MVTDSWAASPTRLKSSQQLSFVVENSPYTPDLETATDPGLQTPIGDFSLTELARARFA